MLDMVLYVEFWTGRGSVWTFLGILTFDSIWTGIDLDANLDTIFNFALFIA